MTAADTWMTQTEAAEPFHVRPAQVRKMMLAAGIPVLDVGPKSWRVRRGDLDRFVALKLQQSLRSVKDRKNRRGYVRGHEGEPVEQEYDLPGFLEEGAA